MTTEGTRPTAVGDVDWIAAALVSLEVSEGVTTARDVAERWRDALEAIGEVVRTDHEKRAVLTLLTPVRYVLENWVSDADRRGLRAIFHRKGLLYVPAATPAQPKED